MIPTRKISETILEFGSSIVQELPEDANKEEFEAVMRIIVSAWNAVVLGEWNKTKRFENELIKALNPSPREMQLIVKRLIMRKKRKYSLDPRAVGNYWIIEKDGEFVFRAEARLDIKGVEAVGEKQ